MPRGVAEDFRAVNCAPALAHTADILTQHKSDSVRPAAAGRFPTGTVTLWAATSTSSASGDNGANPNKVVTITDQLEATSLTGNVARETFTTVAGPTYGTVYRGVAYASN
jgi:hypothetical protein